MTLINVNLSSNYKLVKEGERVLEITDAKVTPSGAPNKITLTMTDIEDKANLLNTYKLDNDKSQWALGQLLHASLGLNDGESFDTKDINKLVGVKLKCEVIHSDFNDRKYANIKKIISRVDTNDATGEVVSGEELSNLINSTLPKGRSAIIDDDLA